jgi:primosomal replication protein N''
LLSAMPAEQVNSVIETCSVLASLWLPARFEGSALGVTKAFPADSAAIQGFHHDMEAFCEAERQRPLLPRGCRPALEVADPASLQQWANQSRARLCALDELGCKELGWLIDAFVPVQNAHSVGKRCMDDLFALVQQLATHPNTRSDQSLDALIRPMSDLALEGWISVAESATRQVSIFGTLRIGRLLDRRRLRRLLAKSTPSVTPAVMGIFLEALRSERTMRGFRSRLSSVSEALRVPQGNLDRALQPELLSRSGTLRALLERVAMLAVVVAASPVRDASAAAARLMTPAALREHFAAVDDALRRYRAQDRSRAALDSLARWIEPQWLIECRARIDHDVATADLIAPIAAALPTLAAYQRFRVRVRDFGDDIKTMFAALRPYAAGLSGDENGIEERTRHLLRREACAGSKHRLEASHPRLLTERQEIENLVRSLAEAETQLQTINRVAVASNCETARIGTQRQWDDITRFTGPRARRLREFVEFGSEIGLTELRPVWLMGPDIASRMLPLRKALFDTVVYDEASQMPVEFAMPTLFRSNVIVVSGDEWQLPPTSFFSTRESDDDDVSGSEPLGEDATDDER